MPEIATFGCLVEIAKQRGYVNAVQVLNSFKEAKTTDEMLHKLAILDMNKEIPKLATA